MDEKKSIQYAVVDAFAAEPFRGNPAVVCYLKDDDAATADERWMQSVAAEFNLPITAFFSGDSDDDDDAGAGVAPRFHLRWFTPVTEVPLCGHATLAAAHFLFIAVLAKHHDVVQFANMTGVLTAKKVPAPESEEQQGKMFIELDFPMTGLVQCNSAGELPSMPKTLNGASVVSVHRSEFTGDLVVELSSAKEVVDLLPNIDEIRKCAGRGVIVTAPAPAGSAYDIFSRFFCPKFGVNEDQVCASAHCVLAPYWGAKLGKQKLTAFQPSTRSGTLYLELDIANGIVRIQGEAVTVMVGTLLA